MITVFTPQRTLYALYALEQKTQKLHRNLQKMLTVEVQNTYQAMLNQTSLSLQDQTTLFSYLTNHSKSIQNNEALGEERHDLYVNKPFVMKSFDAQLIEQLNGLNQIISITKFFNEPYINEIHTTAFANMNVAKVMHNDYLLQLVYGEQPQIIEERQIQEALKTAFEADYEEYLKEQIRNIVLQLDIEAQHFSQIRTLYTQVLSAIETSTTIESCEFIQQNIQHINEMKMGYLMKPSAYNTHAIDKQNEIIILLEKLYAMLFTSTEPIASVELFQKFKAETHKLEKSGYHIYKPFQQYLVMSLDGLQECDDLLDNHKFIELLEHLKIEGKRLYDSAIINGYDTGLFNNLKRILESLLLESCNRIIATRKSLF